MPARAKFLRKRKYHLHDEAPHVHGHGIEYFMKIIMILVTLSFIGGSWCFFTPGLSTAIGAWIFAVGSGIGALFGIYDLVEERHTFKVTRRGFSFSGQDKIENREKGNEFLEHLAFATSGVFFCVGSLFYIPQVAESVGKQAEQFGSWIFISGSAGYIVSCYLNALAMSANHRETSLSPVHNRCHRMHAICLFCSQWGSVLFFSGSFFYRPGLSTSCMPNVSDYCDSALNNGTWMYVVGSALFTVEAILSLVTMVLLQGLASQSGEPLATSLQMQP